MSEDRFDDAAKTSRWQQWFDVRFRTPAAIYGLIVFSALLMITSEHEDDVPGTVLTSFGTLVVFFLAHLFAHTVSDHGKHRLRVALHLAFAHSSGMLYAALPPTIAMLIAGAAGETPDEAALWSLWAASAVLAFLGYVAYSRSGAPQWVRVLGAIGTAMLGGLVAILEYAWH